jgi:PD-(D/E)XK nuclease superfamily protein
MDTNEENKLVLKEEVFQIVGAAMGILNELGHGYHEKPYENALAVEFGSQTLGKLSSWLAGFFAFFAFFRGYS